MKFIYSHTPLFFIINAISSANVSTSSSVLFSNFSIWKVTPLSLWLVTVDGRDGDLLIDYGNFKNFKLNIEIEIDAQKSDLDTVIEEIKSWLYSGVDYSPLVIGKKTFQATYISNLDIAEVYKNVGTCLLIFECKPRPHGGIAWYQSYIMIPIQAC